MRSQRCFPPEQKFDIVKEGLLSGSQVADVCRRHGISSTLYYEWQKRFLAGAREGLNPRDSKTGDGVVEREQLEHIRRLESVVAEITEENLALKKGLGVSAMRRP